MDFVRRLLECVTVATLLTSTNGLDEIKLPPTVIPGQYETCPPQDILKMARQNLSARVDELITGKYTCACIIINSCQSKLLTVVTPNSTFPHAHNVHMYNYRPVVRPR